VPDNRLLRVGSIVFPVAALLYFAVPSLAHHLSPAKGISGGAVVSTNEAIVFGDRRIVGFLVVADGTPLRNDIPTVHFSKFSRMIERSNIEFYQGLIHPEVPPLPFGFIFAPRLESNAGSGFQFIVSPEVLERGDVAAWRFKISEWQRKPPYGPYWFTVTSAESYRIGR